MPKSVLWFKYRKEVTLCERRPVPKAGRGAGAPKPCAVRMTARHRTRATEDNPWGAPIADSIINHLQREGASSLSALRAVTDAAEPVLREALDSLQAGDAVDVEPRYRRVRVTLVEGEEGQS